MKGRGEDQKAAGPEPQSMTWPTFLLLGLSWGPEAGVEGRMRKDNEDVLRGQSMGGGVFLGTGIWTSSGNQGEIPKT